MIKKKTAKKVAKKVTAKRSRPRQSDIAGIEEGMPRLYDEYIELVTPSEVPLEFHVFVFMNMVAALVGDRIYYKEANEIVYPHLWTLLLGESGVGRKSTAMSPAVKILAKTGKVNMLSSKGSQEGFYAELVENGGVGLMRHGELGGLLGYLKKEAMGGFADYLCEIYDPSPAKHKKRLVGEELCVDHFAMTWIAATTPDSLNKCSGHDRISGGFLPRWNIVFGTEPAEYVPWREAKCPDDLDAFVRKLTAMRPTGKKAEEYKFSPQAREWFDGWYRTKRPRLTEGTTANFEIRVLEVVKKYAVLMAFLNHRHTVAEEDIQIALLFGNYYFWTSQRLVGQELYENKFDANCQKVVRAMQRVDGDGGVGTQRELMRRSNLNKQDFEKCVETMVAKGLIRMSVDRKGVHSYVETDGK